MIAPKKLLSRLPGRSDDAPPEHAHRLAARVAALEEAVEESRQLNQRLADVVDVVTELLVPAVDRDDERLRVALAHLGKTLDEAPATDDSAGDAADDADEPSAAGD